MPPTLIAHRGYPLHYPENTQVAIEAAVRTGACYVEFDIQLTADGVPVLLHDADLQRMAGVDQCIHDLTLAQARVFSFGEAKRLGDKFSEVRIATLADIARYLSTAPDTQAFVEIKRASLRRFGVEQVMDAVFAAIANLSQQCVIISFDADALRYTRAHSTLPIGWVFEPWSQDALDLGITLCPEYIFTDHETLPDSITTLPQSGSTPWTWALYEVSDPDLALRLAQRGATLIETNAIGEMLRDARLVA
jgi:glycerophosphoryl diester phosphodiesterase